MKRRSNPSSREEEDEALVGLAATFLNPPRDRELEVRAAVGPSKNRQALWERLSARGLIPDSWVESDARRFAEEPWPSDPRKAAKRLSAVPTSAEAAVTLASDVRGVELAEASAREWHHRVSRMMRRRRLRGVVWRVLPTATRIWPRMYEWTKHWSDLWMVSESAIASSVGSDARYYDPIGDQPVEVQETIRRRRRVDDAFVAALKVRFGVTHDHELWKAANTSAEGMVRDAISSLLAFDEAARCGAVLRANAGWPLVADRTPFGSILNPVAPLMSVYRAGYAAHGIVTMGEDDWVVLIAAPLNPDALPASAFGRRR